MRSSLPLLFVMAAALTGCADQVHILNPRVGRAPVVFESAQAADTFERALDDRYDDGAARIAALHGVLSQNAFFNREVTRADLDGDGIISDREAIRYAER